MRRRDSQVHGIHDRLRRHDPLQQEPLGDGDAEGEDDEECEDEGDSVPEVEPRSRTSTRPSGWQMTSA